MATENVGSIEYEARINTGNFKQDAANVEAGAKGAGDAVESHMGDNLKKAGLVVAGLGAALTVVAKKATDFTVDYVKDANKLAREIGGTAEESSRLLFVTKRLGLETEGASLAFGFFSKQIVAAKDANAGTSIEQDKLKNSIAKTRLELNLTSAEITKNGDKTGELGLKVNTLRTKLQEQESQLSGTKSAFDRLGVGVLDAQGKQKSFTAILLETADKFKTLPAGVDKSKLAMDLFGKTGKDLLPVLNLGSQGIQDLEKRADQLGLTLNQKTIGAVSRYIESQKQLKESTDAMKLAIGTATAPVLTAFNQKLTETINKLLATDGPIKTLTTSVIAFGGPVAGVGGSLLAVAGNLSNVGKAGILTIAKFGTLGLAAASLTAGLTYLEYSIFNIAAKTGSVTKAMQSWQGSIVTSVPIVGQLVGGLAALGGIVFQQEARQRALSSAHDSTTAAQQRAKVATDVLTGANLNAVGANLAVEQAQRNYNNAVAQYGPNSLEARTANYNLAQANDAAKTATEQAKEATNKKAAADKEFAKSKEAEDRLRNQAHAADENRGAFDRAAGAVAGFVRNLFGIPSHVNQPKVSNPFSNNPQFATGVRNFRGGWATVGEHGPELVNLPKGSDVFSNAESQRMTSTMRPTASSLSSMGSNQPAVTVNVTMSGIMSRSVSDERDIAKSLIKRVNDELRSKNLTPIGDGALP